MVDDWVGECLANQSVRYTNLSSRQSLLNLQIRCCWVELGLMFVIFPQMCLMRQSAADVWWWCRGQWSWHTASPPTPVILWYSLTQHDARQCAPALRRGDSGEGNCDDKSGSCFNSLVWRQCYLQSPVYKPTISIINTLQRQQVGQYLTDVVHCKPMWICLWSLNTAILYHWHCW